MTYLAVFLCGVTLGQLSPNTELLSARDDSVKFRGTRDGQFVQYLTTYNLSPEDRRKVHQVLAFQVNSLSLRKRMARPVAINDTVYRIDRRDYGWSYKRATAPLYESDPYFRHEWLDAQAVHDLYMVTGSKYPIIRADRFIAETSFNPHYANHLALPGTLKELKQQFAVQEEAVYRLYLNQQGGVLQSQVALHNRQLERLPTITGYFWLSRDVLDPTGDGNILTGGQTLFALTPDAGEFIWSLPNGLQAYYLADGKGTQLDFADPAIAIDSQTALQDKRVRTAANCIGCHAVGINPVDDVVSKLVLGERGGKAVIVDPSKENVTRLEEMYLSGLADQIAADQQQYARAVEKCNGMTALANSKAHESVVWQYFDGRVDLETACREVGIRVEDAPRLWGHVANGVIAALFAGQSVSRQAWERDGFRDAALAAQNWMGN